MPRSPHDWVTARSIWLRRFWSPGSRLRPETRVHCSSPVAGRRRTSMTTRCWPPSITIWRFSLVCVIRSSASSGQVPRWRNGTIVRGGAAPARPVMTRQPGEVSQPTVVICSQPSRDQPLLPARWCSARSVATSAQPPSGSRPTIRVRSPRAKASCARSVAGRERPRARLSHHALSCRESRAVTWDGPPRAMAPVPGRCRRGLADIAIASPFPDRRPREYRPAPGCDARGAIGHGLSFCRRERDRLPRPGERAG